MPARDETAGVAAVARILARLAEDRPQTVAELASALGLSRSTAFAVAAELDAAGLVERDAAGNLAPGPASKRLGLAAHGFGALAAPAEALLPALRDDADASAALVIRHAGREIVAAQRRATWDNGGEIDPLWIEAAIGAAPSDSTACLRLGLRPNAGEAERRSAAACLECVARRLSDEFESAAEIKRDQSVAS